MKTKINKYSKFSKLLLLILLAASFVWIESIYPSSVHPSSVKAATSPQTQPLIQSSNMSYLGSLKVPISDSISFDGNTGKHCFYYGGNALGYNPINNSLFIGGHDWAQQLAEISIPAINQTATVLQNLTDGTEGKLAQIVPAVSGCAFKLGGSLVYNNRLIVTGYVWYGPCANPSQTVSHGVSGLNLSTPNFKGFFSTNASSSRGVAGWMTTIPSEWQSLLGGPAMTGLCCPPGPQDTSNGPAAIVFNPNDVGVTNPIPTTTLLYYPYPDHPLRDAFSTNLYYNSATNIGGMAFPTGSRSVLFIGRQGTGAFCYGQGTSDPSLAGKPVPPDNVHIYCYDPSELAQGTHSYPYRHQVWAYDANDLFAVKNGKNPWEITPYAIWPLPEMDSSGAADIRGAAYDPARGRLYITQAYGDIPQVDVYQITVPGGTPSFNFTMSNGGARTVNQGSSSTNTITSTLSSGTAAAVSFTASGLPTAAAASFSPTSCNPSCSTTMTVNTTSSTPRSQERRVGKEC